MIFRKITATALVFLLMLSLFPTAVFATVSTEIWDGSTAESFADGDGTADNPYIISNGAELAYFRDLVNAGNSFFDKYIMLSANICLNDTSTLASWSTTPPTNEWSVIGTGDELSVDIYPEDNYEYAYFCGNFDGAGHSITGIYMKNVVSYEYVSLFGCVCEGSISNLRVDDSYFCGGNYVSAIVGDLVLSEASNCHSNATVAGVPTDIHTYTDYIGGIGAYAYESLISGCSFDGIITAEGQYPSYIGGAFGDIGEGATLELCHSNANITVNGTEAYCIGGVVGGASGDIKRCYNAGSVSVNGNDINSIGGVVGYSTGILKDCYNSGEFTVNAQSYIYAVGGVIGNAWDMQSHTVENCYNAGQTNMISPSVSYVGAIVGDPFNEPIYCYYHESITSDNLTNTYGTALSEDYMQDGDSFTGFDFDNVWAFDFNTEYPYPELQNHAWSNGSCVECGKICEHTSRDSFGKCIYCGISCEHEISNGFCIKCGAECPHLYSDGVCEVCARICEHSWYESKCVVCGKACTEHDWNADTSRCNVCGARCRHPNAPTDFCDICGWDMSKTPIWEGGVATSFAGGDGTEENPYLISNGDELAYLAARVNDGDYFSLDGQDSEGNYISTPIYVALTGDIDLGEVEFTSIGDPTSSNSGSFGGCFDGRGYSITGFVGIGQGLFGRTYGDSSNPESSLGRIENLSVFGYIETNSPSFDIGGIVGRAQGGVIQNCSFTGEIKITNAQYYYYGGIVGEMENGFLLDCTSDTVISVEGGHRGVGGVLGGAEYNPPAIIGCVNRGNISATSYGKIGGIASNATDILNCANYGNILILNQESDVWDSIVGGIAGRAYTVTNCYNTGELLLSFAASSGSISGIASELNGDAAVKNCYNTGELNLPEGHGVTVASICSSYNESAVFENVFASSSSYPTYYAYNDTTYENEASFVGQMSFDAMKSTDFTAVLNAWVEQNPTAEFTDYDNNVYTFNYVSWKQGVVYPALYFEPDATVNTVVGDADGDGVLTNQDITLIIRYLNGWSVDTVTDSCDMNSDGKINNRDAIALIKLVMV